MQVILLALLDYPYFSDQIKRLGCCLDGSLVDKAVHLFEEVYIRLHNTMCKIAYFAGQMGGYNLNEVNGFLAFRDYT